MGVTGAIDAHVIGLLNHTYVTTFDGRKFGCFGRDAGGSLIQTANGDCDLAECIALHAIGGPSGIPTKVIGMSGIVYVITGVCHQAANRILWSAGIKLPLTYPLIKRSVQQFGFYGKEFPWLPTETNWQFRQQACSNPPFAGAKVCVSATTQQSVTAPTQKEIDQMPNDSDDAEQELRAELLELLKAGLPSRRVSAHRFEKLVLVHKMLRDLQNEFAEQYRDTKINEQQYLHLCKRAAHAADKQGEEILGFDDYHRAFGSPETVEDLYMPQDIQELYQH